MVGSHSHLFSSRQSVALGVHQLHLHCGGVLLALAVRDQLLIGVLTPDPQGAVPANGRRSVAIGSDGDYMP